MRAETESSKTPSVALRETLSDESLTDIIDQLRRRAFQKSLDRRHASVPYRVVIESARLVRTSTP
jgi:hypothetical protein